MRKLPASLGSTPFTTRDAMRAGLSYYELRKLVKDGTLEQMARGVYRLSGQDLSDEEAFAAASARIGFPSAVCLVSALAHYHLTDLIPKKTWLLVEVQKRTQHKDIRVLRTRDPRWNVGIERRKDYWITAIERTLVEALIYKSLIGTSTAIESLRRAVQNKKASLGKVMEMGERLGVAHRIRPYIEALA